MGRIKVIDKDGTIFNTYNTDPKYIAEELIKIFKK